MEKKFVMENDIGLMVNYTILAITEDKDSKYVIYTNYLPSDNELGVRLFAGKLVGEKPVKVEGIPKNKESKLIEDFKLEVIKTGKKVRRVK